MTLTPPVITPVAVDPISITFRANQDLQPFSYRSTMTFGELLNSMKNWMYNVLVPYLNTNFEDITGSWLDNITEIDTAINTALSAQADQINSALTTQQQQVADELATTLNQITTGESAALNDSAVYNALRVANSQALALLDSRYMKSGNFVVVNNLPGIVLDGSADVSGILNTALAAAPANSFTNLVVYPNAFGFAKLRIDNKVTIDISKSGIVAPYGGLTFDASHINLTNGVAMNFTASAAFPNNGAPGGVKIGPFRLIGPGRSNAGTVGILISTPTAGGGSLGQIRDVIVESVHVEEFGIGHQWNNNGYCVPFINCTIKGCGIDIQPLNAGERLTYISCIFSDSPTAVNSATQGGMIFIGCSFDYHTAATIQLDGEMTIELQNCHIERSVATDGNASWFNISGGALKIFGGRILGTGTYDPTTAPVTVFSNTADPTYGNGVILLDGVTFGSSLKTTSGKLCAGTGSLIVRNTQRQNQYQSAFLVTGSAANLFSDQNIGTILEDDWFITSDTATITSSSRALAAVTGTNGNITLTSGVRRNNNDSVKINKTGATNTAFAGAVAVPIRGGSMLGAMYYIARNATITGTAKINVYAAKVISDSGGLRIARSTNIHTDTINVATDLAASTTFYLYTTSDYARRAPGWATHMVIEIDLTAMSPGALFFTDVIGTEF